MLLNKLLQADFGYDISDFYDIQPEYGTLADFDRLIAKAKSLNIKIVLDFVPNHSSDENDWFIKSVNKDPDYADFYLWHPGYIDEHNTSKRLPPSNWLSIFRGSAWEWNDKREEFYFHQFLKKQPDLNYRNPKVVEEMKVIFYFQYDLDSKTRQNKTLVPYLIGLGPKQVNKFVQSQNRSNFST